MVDLHGRLTLSSCALINEQILRSIGPEHGHPVTRTRIMKATVLPRILPETQALIDLHRLRFESEIDALHDESKLMP